MSAPKIAVVFYKYKTYANGTHPVMIRITANRKSSYLTTGYSIRPENWDEENSRLIETRSKEHPEKKPLSNAKAINTDIELQVSKVIKAKQDVSMTNQPQTSFIIKSKIDAKYTAAENFLEYGKVQTQLLKDKSKIRTAKNYTSVLKRISEFMDSKPLLFSDLTVSFLSQYEAFLIKDGLMPNTVAYHFRTIRCILYKAMNETDPLFPQERNPFFKIKIKKAKTKKEVLNQKDIEKLINAKLKLPEQKKLANVRNYYLFSYYNAGIRISDLIQLKVKDVLDKRLHYEMGKTGHFKSIKLNAESKTILKSYKRSNAKPDDFLFPLLDNNLDYSDPEFLRGQVESKAAMINGELKKLAVAAKVEKRIHFHSSRHSFTDLARKKGADIYNISKALAHQSIPATENYLKDFDEESLDKTMDMIFKKQATK